MPPMYVEAVAEVQIFADAFNRMVAAALPVDDSMALIARMDGRQHRQVNLEGQMPPALWSCWPVSE